jgi:hypothetical protein
MFIWMIYFFYNSSSLFNRPNWLIYTFLITQLLENPLIGLRKRTSQREKMASEEGLSQDEKEFRKNFFAMSEIMMKVFYDDYL